MWLTAPPSTPTQMSGRSPSTSYYVIWDMFHYYFSLLFLTCKMSLLMRSIKSVECCCCCCYFYLFCLKKLKTKIIFKFCIYLPRIPNVYISFHLLLMLGISIPPFPSEHFSVPLSLWHGWNIIGHELFFFKKKRCVYLLSCVCVLLHEFMCTTCTVEARAGHQIP